MDGTALFLHVSGLVEERKLDVDGTVKIIEEVAPILKNQVFVLVLRQLIIDIEKLYLFCEKMFTYHTDTIPAHLPVGDGLLGGVGYLAVPLGFLDGRGQPPLLLAGQFGVRCQTDGVPQVGFIVFVLPFCGLQIFYLFCLLFLQ